ncbi:MAG: cytochrome c biogenesis protein CcdA [Thermomicrobiales bacterium]
MARLLLPMVAVLTVILLIMPGTAAAKDAPDYGADYLDGAGSFTLDQFKGDVVLLNVWATWCEPCKREMPELNAISKEFEDQGLRVIGVSIDRMQSDDALKQFAANHNASYTLAKDPKDRFSTVFKTSGVPVTLLIDRSGNIAYQWQGELDEGSAENRQLIAAALASSGPVASSDLPKVAAIGFIAAFGAGLLSVLSPCVFPLIPTYAAYITGISVDEMLAQKEESERKRTRRITLRNGLIFVAGFSLVFIAMGASASAIGGLLHDYRVWIARIGGILLLVMGAHMLGLLRIPVLDRIIRPQIGGNGGGGRSANPLGTLAVGMAFGAGWTPCIGPALASILTLAAATASMGQGIALLTVYSLGLAVPFLLGTVLIDRFMRRRAEFGPWLPRLERISAVLILAIGILMLTGLFDQLATYTSRFPALV